MKPRKSWILLCISLCLAVSPASAGRISLGTQSPGTLGGCSDEFIFTITGGSFLEDAGNVVCSIGEFNRVYDLFSAGISPGDTITLKVKHPTASWGLFPQYFDTGGSLDPIHTGACDSNAIVQFTCADSSDGTIFSSPVTSFPAADCANPEIDPGSVFPCNIGPPGPPLPQGVTFFTDPNELLFISVTDANGIESVLYGSKPTRTPTSGSACNGAFRGTFNGDVTVAPGQTCTFLSGGITGNVHVIGGRLELDSASVGGSVRIEGDSTFSIRSATINGNLNIRDLGTTAPGPWPPQCAVCDSSIHGTLTFDNNGAPVLIGGLGGFLEPNCPGNVVDADIEVFHNNDPVSNEGPISKLRGIEIDSNTVRGNLDVVGNTGPIGISGNTIQRGLNVGNNTTLSGFVLVEGNVVGGDLNVSNDTAVVTLPLLSSRVFFPPIQITSNHIGGQLKIIQDTAPDVAANTVQGDLDVKNNILAEDNVSSGFPGFFSGCFAGMAAACIASNTVFGDLNASNNAGSTELSGNTISGNLHAMKNAGPTTDISGNTIVGNLDALNNAGSTDVSFNIAPTGNLNCEMNSTVTGSANFVKHALGQCTTFVGSPQIIVQPTSVSRDSNGNVLIVLLLSNIGNAEAEATRITVARIGSTDSTGSMGPVDIFPSGSSGTTLVFPLSVGGSGSQSSLTIRGKYIGGRFSFTLPVTLP